MDKQIGNDCSIQLEELEDSSLTRILQSPLAERERDSVFMCPLRNVRGECNN